MPLLSEDDFESSLDTVCEAAAGSIEGVFGPASLTWRVDREAAVFLGAGRALLLQLAHPWVAAAIAEHSRTFADPIASASRRGDRNVAVDGRPLRRGLSILRQ
jgi:uncharacterized protein (DUF2236 family)